MLTMTQAVCDETVKDRQREAAGRGAWWVVAFAVEERGWLVDKSYLVQSQSSHAHCWSAMQGTLTSVLSEEI